MCYDTKLIGQGAKCSKWKKSHRQFNRLQRATAYIHLRQQYKLLRSICHRVVSVDTGARLIIDTLLSDETKQRLRMDLGTSTNTVSGHMVQSPHVFISMRTCTLIFESGQVFTLRLVCPPHAMLSTDAGSLHAVLCEFGGIASHRVFRQAFATMGRSRFMDDLLKLRCLDGAGGNKVIIHFEFLCDEKEPSTFGVSKHCGLHATNIMLANTATSCYQRLPEQLFTASKFLAMGSFFLRMIYRLGPLTSAMVNIRIGQPDPFWQRCAEGIKSIVTLSHKQGLLFSEQRGEKLHRKPSYDDDLDFLFTMFNGPLLQDGDDAGWSHVCAGETCCPGGRPQTLMRFRACTMRVPLRRRPPIAAMSRWTVMGPSTDTFLLLLVLGVP